MKLHLFAAVLAISTLANSTAATPAGKTVGQVASPPEQFNPVKSFENLIAQASAPSGLSEVRYREQSAKWVKQTLEHTPVKYDVQKTDSLVNPYSGYVKLHVTVYQTEPFETKEQAESATSSDPRLTSSYDVEGQYAGSDSAWRLIGFRYNPIYSDPIIPKFEYRFYKDNREKGKVGPLDFFLQRWIPATR